MFLRNLLLIGVLIAGAEVLVGCSGGGASVEDSGKPLVFVSIQPQKEFVERVAGDRVSVSVLVQPGHSPATYEPTPQQMADISKAKLLFRIGVPFESALLPKIQGVAKQLKVIDTRKGIELYEFEMEEGHKHHGHDHGDHTHEAGELDPHIWLDPMLVKKQSELIRDALIKIDPAGEKVYTDRCLKFSSELEKLHKRLQQTLGSLKGKEFFVYHPAYGYFARAYGLKQTSVETGGKEPGLQDLTKLIKRAKDKGVKVIFVQPQFSTKSAEVIAKEIGGVVVLMDPLAEDYIKNMEEMAVKIEKAFQ